MSTRFYIRHQIYANREESSIYKRHVKPIVEDLLRRLKRKWYTRSEECVSRVVLW
jgi:hypothetical protein